MSISANMFILTIFFTDMFVYSDIIHEALRANYEECSKMTHKKFHVNGIKNIICSIACIYVINTICEIKLVDFDFDLSQPSHPMALEQLMLDVVDQLFSVFLVQVQG